METITKYKDQPNSNYMYQIHNGILILKIECTYVASPWNYNDTIAWYKEALGYELEEPLDISFVDVSKERLWITLDKDYKHYDNILNLFNSVDNLVKIVFGLNDKISQIIYHDGELKGFILAEDYCKYKLTHGRLMAKPEIITSTDY